MKEFIRKHDDRIHGVLSCFDRMLFRGYLPIMSGWAMATFLTVSMLNGSRLKPFLSRTLNAVKDCAVGMAQSLSFRFQKGGPFVQSARRKYTYSQLDERLHYFYGATYMSPAIGMKKAGPGSNYVQAFKDRDGNRIDGGKSYRLHLPANVPAAAFWSLTLYDTATRSMFQNPSNDAAHSSYDKTQDERGRLGVDLDSAPKAPRWLGEQLD